MGNERSIYYKVYDSLVSCRDEAVGALTVSSPKIFVRYQQLPKGLKASSVWFEAEGYGGKQLRYLDFNIFWFFWVPNKIFVNFSFFLIATFVLYCCKTTEHFNKRQLTFYSLCFLVLVNIKILSFKLQFK